MIEAKAFRTFTRIYSLFKSERLSANIKLTLHKAPSRSVMSYACPAWELAADTTSLKIAAPAKQGPMHHWKFSTVHTGPRFAHGFQPYEGIQLYRSIGQDEARHRKFKRLKLDGGQVYDRSSD
jgi:hypothetical protein